MSDHQNLQLMRRTIDAFRSGDMSTLAQVFSKDVVWRVPGRSLLANDYKGQGEVFGFFGRLMELTGGTFRVESVDMLANDSGGVFVDRLTAERNGRKLDVRLLLHVTIKDGRIVEGVDHFHSIRSTCGTRSGPDVMFPGHRGVHLVRPDRRLDTRSSRMDRSSGEGVFRGHGRMADLMSPSAGMGGGE